MTVGYLPIITDPGTGVRYDGVPVLSDSVVTEEVETFVCHTREVEQVYEYG